MQLGSVHANPGGSGGIDEVVLRLQHRDDEVFRTFGHDGFPLLAVGEAAGTAAPVVRAYDGGLTAFRGRCQNRSVAAASFYVGGSSWTWVAQGAKRSPSSATRASTSGAVKDSGSPSAQSLTSSQVMGVDTVGRVLARSE